MVESLKATKNIQVGTASCCLLIHVGVIESEGPYVHFYMDGDVVLLIHVGVIERAKLAYVSTDNGKLSAFSSLLESLKEMLGIENRDE